MIVVRLGIVILAVGLFSGRAFEAHASVVPLVQVGSVSYVIEWTHELKWGEPAGDHILALIVALDCNGLGVEGLRQLPL